MEEEKLPTGWMDGRMDGQTDRQIDADGRMIGGWREGGWAEWI